MREREREGEGRKEAEPERGRGEAADGQGEGPREEQKQRPAQAAWRGALRSVPSHWTHSALKPTSSALPSYRVSLMV